MKEVKKQMIGLLVVWMVWGGWGLSAWGYTTVFFNEWQVKEDVAAGVNSDTIRSEGYVFEYTMDKLFTGGVGMTEPIGRVSSVSWPVGVAAQAITVGPNVGMGARVILSRVDGDVFDLTLLTFKLLANTGGAGGALEIMPKVNGEDAFNDPLYFFASGYTGNTFTYDTSASYLGSTALLKGYAQYTMSLYVDFALTGLVLEGAEIPEPGSGMVVMLGLGVVVMGRRGVRCFKRCG